MTEDDQLPFEGPSDTQRSQPRLDADEAQVAAGAPSSARDGDDPSDESLTPEGHDVAEEPSESGDRPTEMSEPFANEAVFVSERVAPARTLYFLTNRMNLNGILSSRLVAPRESFQKYYTDLLQQTPGWVPLLREAPTAWQIEAVTSERGAGAPVIVEFPLDVVGKVKSDVPVVYVPAVALSEAVAIHLPSERDLRGHRARGYSNVHPHDGLLRVTPELFQSDASDSVTIIPPSPAPAVDWRRIDRIRGAVNAAFGSVTSGEQLALAAALVGATKLPAVVSVPPWFGWLDLDDHAAPDSRPEPDIRQPDHVAFRAAYDVLGDRDVTEAWNPNEVLDAVEGRVREAGLAEGAADAMVRNLGRVRSIVNVEVDFEPFRPSARALFSAKALLLVLLRQELDQLLAWSDEETGADDATRIVAAVLAGRLRGLSRESTELRSLELDDLTAAWAVRVAGGGSPFLGKARFIANSRGTSLKIDGVEVATQSALLPDLLSKYQKTADAKKEATRIKVSRAMGWPVTHRLSVPSGAATSEEGGVLTILTPGEVELTISVDEEEFLLMLNAISGSARRRAYSAFDVRKP